jgi:hypothetical protein
MNPADIRKLLGGYAAGILTEEERRALFEAALTDQDLFNELAREQALKEVLDDPGARRQLLAALEEKPSLVDRLRAWMGRPVAWVAAGSLAVAALLVVVVVRRAEAPLAPEPVMTAKLEAPALPAPPLTTIETAKDREKAANAPIAIPAAPPAPARKAQPELPYEIAASKAMRADAVAQAPAAVEVRPGAVPAGVLGGGAGGSGGPAPSQAGAQPPAAAPEMVGGSAQNGQLDYVVVNPTMQAQEAVRGEARQLNSLGRFAAADALADKKLNEAVVPPPVAYRILRAGADGKFAEAPAGTAFRAADRVRVIFSPPSAGRLVATAANRPKPLLDRAVKQSATVNVDVPAGVSSLQVTFTAQPAAAPAPVTFSIAIPREPAP